MLCVICPTGCRIRVSRLPGTSAARAASPGSAERTPSPVVRGAACDRGREYALAECETPMRMFTGTVRVTGGQRTVVAVRSDRLVDREVLVELARAAARVRVDAPVDAGSVLATGLPGDSALIATASVGAARA